MNSQMRRIDLVCKLLGPFFISIMDGISTETAILVNLGMNCTSVVVEYITIARVSQPNHTSKIMCSFNQVYYQVPELQHPKTMPTIATHNDENIQQPSQGPWTLLKKAAKKSYQDLRLYFKHPVFIPSFSVALLYCTVLSFGGVMVTYLLSNGYTSTEIAIARTVSVAFEVLATWIGPWLMTKIGPVRAGLWFSSWQLGCLAVGISIFWKYTDNVLISTLGLVCGSMLSRVGLWGFDLSAQIIIQEVSLVLECIMSLRLLTLGRYRRSKRRIGEPFLPWKLAGRTYSKCARTHRQSSSRHPTSSTTRRHSASQQCSAPGPCTAGS